MESFARDKLGTDTNYNHWRERDSDSDGLLLTGFYPIERGGGGGGGGGIVTNAKRSTYVHILNIMDTAMLF